jgi:GNAT superfamily N-acetyltransferase
MSIRLGKYLFDVRTLPHDACLAWRLEGWAGVWSEIRERTVFRLHRRGHFLVIEQDLSSFRAASPPPGVRLAVVTPEEWPRLGEIIGARKLVRYRANAARGRTCIAAWRGDRPIGYTWLSDRMEAEIEVYPLPLPEDAAYLWDLYVIPEERSSGVGSALVAARLLHARERGFRTGWRMISPRNTASMRTLAKTSGPGTRILGEVHYRKWLSRARVDYQPAAADAETPPGATV